MIIIIWTSWEHNGCCASLTSRTYASQHICTDVDEREWVEADGEWRTYSIWLHDGRMGCNLYDVKKKRFHFAAHDRWEFIIIQIWQKNNNDNAVC